MVDNKEQKKNKGGRAPKSLLKHLQEAYSPNNREKVEKQILELDDTKAAELKTKLEYFLQIVDNRENEANKRRIQEIDTLTYNIDKQKEELLKERERLTKLIEGTE